MTCDASKSVEEYLGSKHAIGILLALHTNPGVCKTDVMRAIGRERTVFLRLNEGMELGLIRMDVGHNPHNKAILSLTDRGHRLASHLERMLKEAERWLWQ